MPKTVQEFLEYVQNIRKVASSTLKVYKSILTEFSKYPLNEAGLKKYLSDIASQKPRTQERKIIVVRNFLNWALRHGYLKECFWEELRPPRYKHLPKWLPEEQIQKVLKAAKHPYDKIFEFFYRTGLRIGELENLKPKDVFKTNEYVLLRVRGKGNKERLLKISHRVFQLLKDAGWPNKLPNRRRIQKEAQRISKELGIHVTPHVFRHSFAVKYLQNGMPITQIQALLGHANLNTTAVYTQMASDSVLLD